jgi:hypothetical protein
MLSHCVGAAAEAPPAVLVTEPIGEDSQRDPSQDYGDPPEDEPGPRHLRCLLRDQDSLSFNPHPREPYWRDSLRAESSWHAEHRLVHPDLLGPHPLPGPPLPSLHSLTSVRVSPSSTSCVTNRSSAAGKRSRASRGEKTGESTPRAGTKGTPTKTSRALMRAAPRHRARSSPPGPSTWTWRREGFSSFGPPLKPRATSGHPSRAPLASASTARPATELVSSGVEGSCVLYICV